MFVCCWLAIWNVTFSIFYDFKFLNIFVKANNFIYNDMSRHRWIKKKTKQEKQDFMRSLTSRVLNECVIATLRETLKGWKSDT